MALDRNVSELILRLRDEVSKNSAKVNSAIGRMRKQFNDLRPQILRATAALTAISAAIFAAAKRTANYADELIKAARSTGVGVESLSALKHAADLSGVSFQELQQALIRFSANIVDFQNGIGEAKRTFEQLGVTVKKEGGTLKTTEELFIETAEKLSQLEDGTQKTAAAYEIFGRAGARLIPLLNQGEEGIRKATEEARKLGLIIDTKTGVAAENFNDSLTRMKRFIDGLVFAIGNELIPKFNSLFLVISRFFDIPVPEELELTVRIRALRNEITQLQTLMSQPGLAGLPEQMRLGKALAELEDLEDKLEGLRKKKGPSGTPSVIPADKQSAKDTERFTQQVFDSLKRLEEKRERIDEIVFQDKIRQAEEIKEIFAELEQDGIRNAEEHKRAQEEAARKTEEAWGRAGDSVSNIIEAFTRSGKLNVAGLINDVLKLIIAVRQATTTGIKLPGGGGGGTGGIGNVLGGLLQFLPSFQTKPGEIFKIPGPPNQARLATVHGGETIGRPGPTVQIFQDFRGAQRGVRPEVRRAIAEAMAVTKQETKFEIREGVLRGGSFAKAFRD